MQVDTLTRQMTFASDELLTSNLRTLVRKLLPHLLCVP
jgi:hypothetical protein